MHLQLSKTIEDEKPILLWVGDDIYKTRWFISNYQLYLV